MSRINLVVKWYLKGLIKNENWDASTEEPGLGSAVTWLILGKSPDLSGPQFLHLHNGAKNAHPATDQVILMIKWYHMGKTMVAFAKVLIAYKDGDNHKQPNTRMTVGTSTSRGPALCQECDDSGPDQLHSDVK